MTAPLALSAANRDRISSGLKGTFIHIHHESNSVFR
jgi:hypothetical protein